MVGCDDYGSPGVMEFISSTYSSKIVFQSCELIEIEILGKVWDIRVRRDTDRFSFFLGITLGSLIVPVAFGIYVNYRWPKQAKVILKVSTPRPPPQPTIRHRDGRLNQ